MNRKTIVADASPLIAFGRINQIKLLSDIVGEIIIPEAVAEECVRDNLRSGASEIRKAIHHKIISIHANPNEDKYKELLDILGKGEAAAIVLASEQIDKRLLIDEKLGRQVAKKLNLKVIGTAGVLLLAKQKKKITQVSPLINQLKKSGYYLSNDLISEILKQANEV